MTLTFKKTRTGIQTVPTNYSKSCFLTHCKTILKVTEWHRFKEMLYSIDFYVHLLENEKILENNRFSSPVKRTLHHGTFHIAINERHHGRSVQSNFNQGIKR
jgi:hypothetical protein